MAKPLKAVDTDTDSTEDVSYQVAKNSIVPDHTSSILIAFYHERGESRIESFPIIAWRVSHGVSEPITVEELDAPVYCIKLTTELWVFKGDTTFTDEEKALEYGRSRARSYRER